MIPRIASLFQSPLRSPASTSGGDPALLALMAPVKPGVKVPSPLPVSV